MPKFIDLTGKKFNRLTVVKKAENVNGLTAWLCLCECGNEVVLAGKYLKSNNTKSCGCLKLEGLTNRSLRHGATTGRTMTPEYRVWAQMKKRCLNPKCRGYENYGGRGIEVCSRWNSFENFLDDMGKKPAPNYSIERIDVNGNYEPGNCEWIPFENQCNNKRTSHLVTAFGETKSMMAWAKDERCSVSYTTLRGRLNEYGWTPERAITAPGIRERDGRGRYINDCE